METVVALIALTLLLVGKATLHRSSAANCFDFSAFGDAVGIGSTSPEQQAQ